MSSMELFYRIESACLGLLIKLQFCSPWTLLFFHRAHILQYNTFPIPQGQLRMLNFACAAKARPRLVSLTR